MDGDCNNEIITLEQLISKIELNTTDLKLKLKNIIVVGKDYEEDVAKPLTKLLKNNDKELVSLSLQAIAEIVKSENKRILYASKEHVVAILNILKVDINRENIEILKHSCRCLGNLCCDCDVGRRAILDCNGSLIIKEYFDHISSMNGEEINEIHAYSCQFLLNFCLGGLDYTKPLLEVNIIDSLFRIMLSEYEKNNCNGKIISIGLLLLSVFNENSPDLIFMDELNRLIVNVLKTATEVDIAESCFDCLLLQAEHDTVKTLLAKENVVELLCLRLELALQRRASGDISPDNEEVKAVTKQACDLIILILTGDEAMEIVFSNGIGVSYLQIVTWLDANDCDILSTAALAVGDFARTDTHCLQMMNDGVFDKLLELFERHHTMSAILLSESNSRNPIDEIASSKIEFALLSALRNLSVPQENKKIVAARGKAVPILLKTLPEMRHAHVAYKLIATLRMLADGQEGVCSAILCSAPALRSVVAWGGGDTSFAAEAPRLLARVISNCASERARILEIDGCVTCLVSMLLTTHTIMQNEAILALTLLAIEAQQDTLKPTFIEQLLKSEIGKHIAVLLDTNSAKIPEEVAVNLLAFLDITVRNNVLANEYKVAKVHEGLRKLEASRNGFSSEFIKALNGVVLLVSDC